MGRSYTKLAGLAFDSLVSQLKHESQLTHNPSNTWDKKGVTYFHEIGSEQPDGAITGSIQKFVGENRARSVGGFRIEPDGSIKRFPTSTKTQRNQAYQDAYSHFEPKV